MKETSLFCIYMNIYAKGDVFLRRKVGIILMIAFLVCVVIGSQYAGEYVYEHADAGDDAETAAKTAEALVVVDSGHGGSDPGKIGINGALEKEVNLEISKKLETLLKKQGIKVIMTREDDGSIADSKVEDLKKRVAIINQEKPVLAVSIHQNSYQTESIHGAQVFYYTHSEEGEAAAKIIQETLLSVDSENTRSAKANDTYYLLKKTEAPVVIVECGFLSNQAEADLLITEEYQQKMAEAIAGGIQKYIETAK